jgi:hypothetical protein
MAKQHPHSDPHKNEGKQNERHVSGGIHVRGEIEAQLPPSLIEKYDAERTEDKVKDRKKFVVEILTLLVVAIYALFTFGILRTMTRANKITNDTLEIAQRA